MALKSNWPKYIFQVKPLTFDKLKRLSKIQGKTMSSLMNEILEQYTDESSIKIKLTLFSQLDNEKDLDGTNG